MQGPRGIGLHGAFLLAGLIAVADASAQVTQRAPVTARPQIVQAAPAQGVPAADATTTTAVVAAASAWTPAGVSVRRGGRLVVTAQGRWSVGGAPVTAAVANTATFTGPDGIAGRVDPKALLPSASIGALIGRIGADGAPFLIGSKYDAAVAADGPLLLAINDEAEAFADNQGRVSVSVTARAPTATPPRTTLPGVVLTRPVIPRLPLPLPTPTPTPTPNDTGKPTRPGAGAAPTDSPPVLVPGKAPPNLAPPAPDVPPRDAAGKPGATPPPLKPPTATPVETKPAETPPVEEKPPEPTSPATPAPATPPPATTQVTPGAPATPVAPTTVAPVAPTPWPDWATPVAILAAAALALLLVMQLRPGGRGRSADDARGPARASGIGSRVASDGRADQTLSVKWRGR